jgi:CheY-like chemotaxis protein
VTECPAAFLGEFGAPRGDGTSRRHPPRVRFTDLFFAINLHQHHHIRHLPIVDEHDHLLGLVTHENLRQTSRPLAASPQPTEAKGYRILLAKNGEEAIALAKSENPNLILMDIQMPGMDGLEAMQHIRCDPNLVDLPIVALTALAMTGDHDRCLAAGANDFLTKPVKLKQLASTIQQLLASK